MERQELDFILSCNGYLKGGTKEACVKVRDFLRHAKTSENKLSSDYSCVTAEEFVEAVKTLMAFSAGEKDAIPKKWKCDADCSMISYLICPGEFNTSQKAEDFCPFFMDEGFI